MEDRKMNGVTDTTDILHHIGLVNTSLGSSAACCERLGFTLTPLSLPRIILRPGGPPELLGAGNRHAIFTNNYLELLGIVDAGRWAEVTKEQRGPYDLDVPLSRYEGLHVMHFGTSHIENVKERLDNQGVACSAVREFQRNIQTGSGERMMRARTIHFPAQSNPEGLLQVAQHDTPELVFQDRYMHHRNGAVALTEILVVTETPGSYAAKYELYSGHKSKEKACSFFEAGLSETFFNHLFDEESDFLYRFSKHAPRQIPSFDFTASMLPRMHLIIDDMYHTSYRGRLRRLYLEAKTIELFLLQIAHSDEV